MFRLLRYFSVASLISLTLATVALGVIHRQSVTRHLLENGESNNVALTQILANALWPQLTAFIEATERLDTDALRRHAGTSALRHAVVDEMRDTRVVKVKLYSLEGRTLFSTEVAQIGEDKRGNAGFQAARAGRPISEITHRNQFSAFDRVVENRDLLSSYVPLRQSPQAPIEGVLEVYTDVTGLLENVARGQQKVTLYVVAVLAMLYAILFFIVRHADKVIKAQSQRQRDTEQALRESQDYLDQRVRERTAELEIVNRALETEIAERKQAEQQIQYLAYHDALTGLPNRTMLADRLGQAVLHARRYERTVSVLFIDLDNFKLINDSLGHSGGDALLKTVADRMTQCVRGTDTVARLGGDEFVIVLFDQSEDRASIIATLHRICEAIGQPVIIGGQKLQVTCSMGLATYPGDGLDAETLLMNADAAMYRAKELGRNNYQFYTPEMNVKVNEKLAWQEGLRGAIARGELKLLYQPQVDLRTGGILGVEALIRWQHPEFGMVPPDKFIPLAEESGMILSIGDWVLQTACRQNKAWQDAGMPAVTMSVNVSARQFREKGLVEQVAHALRKSGLAAQYLELELTESLIMQDLEQAVATMRELKAMGVQIAIDDFGTGYSSLSALKSFPITRLKIDRSFMREIPGSEDDRAIAEAVISLGQKLDLRVIAEGVETEEQLAFLLENECDEMQGYKFSKPVSADEVEEMFRTQHDLSNALRSGRLRMGSLA